MFRNSQLYGHPGLGSTWGVGISFKRSQTKSWDMTGGSNHPSHPQKSTYRPKTRFLHDLAVVEYSPSMALKNGSPDVNSKMGDDGSFSMGMNENRKKNQAVTRKIRVRGQSRLADFRSGSEGIYPVVGGGKFHGKNPVYRRPPIFWSRITLIPFIIDNLSKIRCIVTLFLRNFRFFRDFTLIKRPGQVKDPPRDTPWDR